MTTIVNNARAAASLDRPSTTPRWLNFRARLNRWWQRQGALSIASALAIGVLALPVTAGMIGVLLPAFGWLPATGARQFSLEPWRLLLAQPGLGRSILISLACGLVSATGALVIVTLFLAGFTGTRMFGRVRRLISPLLSVPHAAAAFGLAFLIAPSGWIARLLSPWATGWTRPPDWLIVNDSWGLSLMAALVSKEVPFLLLMSLAALPQIDAPNRLALARTLGYGPVTAWFKVIWPALYPLIRLPVFAVIAYATAVVDMAMIIGPGNPPTLGVMVLRWQTDPDLSMRLTAAAGALLLLLVTLLALALWIGAERLLGVFSTPLLTDGRRDNGDRTMAVLGGAGMIAVAVALIMGLCGLAVWSLAGLWPFTAGLPALSLANWQAHGPAIPQPLLATLTIAALATAAATIIVIGALENEVQRNRRPNPGALLILYLPLLVPPVAFLFGLSLVNEALGLRPGFWPVVAGHMIFVLPYVYLSLSEAYRRLDRRWSLLARSLGRSEWQTILAVRLPLLLTPILTALAVGMSVSVGQYLATQLLGAGRVLTVTTEAVALASGGDRRVIGVWALTQSLLPMAGFLFAIAAPRLIWRHRRDML